MTKIARLGSFFITVVEVLVLGALIVLELLSGYRAGLMQHLYFKKIHYLETLYHHGNMVFHIVGLLFCVFLTYRLQDWRTMKVRRLAPFGIICLLLISSYLCPFVKELNIYAYLLICLECCLVLETFRIFLTK